MLLMIDNYDSFTFNLVQYFGELGEDVRVFRNDKITLAEIDALGPERIVISPGPCSPEEAGISVATIRRFCGKIPILGVCLGHQAIGAAFDGKVIRSANLMHGKTSPIHHDGRELFKGLPDPFEATRYHSLIVERSSLPPCLEMTAWVEEGEIMGLRHRELPVWGVQFHPESILTVGGMDILRNFLEMTNKKDVFMIKKAIARVVERENLSEAEMIDVMDQIMSGEATPAQIAAFITALRMKGETVAEITGAARVMRDKVTRIRVGRNVLDIDRDDINIDQETILDVVGTGGCGTNTFNISTTVAFVVSACGVKVAKHGNRAVSSSCGSADVLESLGVNLDVTPETVERCINEVGIGFLFAPALHGAMKYAIGPRKEIGIRTIFNILGPLTNPAGAECQLLGVYSNALVEPIAHVLRNLGCRRGFVVHGLDGMDEITLTTETRIAEVSPEGVVLKTFQPEELGLSRCCMADLRGGDAAGNATIVRAVLAGESGPRRDIVLLNATFSLVAAGRTAALNDGLALAAGAIDSGRALEQLEKLAAMTNV